MTNAVYVLDGFLLAQSLYARSLRLCSMTVVPFFFDDLVLNADVAMMFSWVWVWLVFMFVFLVPPIGYGWGYRRWGPPYPRYMQRRRAERASATDTSASFDHHAWGWRGDFVWMVLLVGMMWVVASVFWR